MLCSQWDYALGDVHAEFIKLTDRFFFHILSEVSVHVQASSSLRTHKLNLYNINLDMLFYPLFMGWLFPRFDYQFLKGKFYSFSILSTDYETFIILLYSNHLIRVIND